ncbi:hypothetical protein SCUCBS95973_002940 [Sporothrix curviconia]|uniref:Uncharacterized protein n=1 Tax=Sporothrix curviconia TaxID=1260050 RepID=A0ABP0BB79_9PEZI
MASPLAGPGVFWISSNTSDTAVFSYDDLVRWYEEVHIPDMMHADTEQPLPVARRYEALSSTEKPFLVVYKMPDLAFVASDAFRKIPLHHETLPGCGPIAQYAHFRGRFARFERAWESPGREGKEGREGTLLISEVTAGDSAADGHAPPVSFYKDVQRLPGWLRSSQYTIVMENDIGGDTPPPRSEPPTAGAPPPAHTPRRLSLHEFEGTQTVGDLAEDHVGSQSTTAWSSTGAETAERSVVEVLAFRLVRTYGDQALAFAERDVGRQ